MQNNAGNLENFINFPTSRGLNENLNYSPYKVSFFERCYYSEVTGRSEAVSTCDFNLIKF